MKCTRILVKLKSARGETLVEALVAILISSLAMLMLAMAISSTSGIVMSGRGTMDTYYAKQQNVVEQTTPTSTSAVCDIAVTVSGGTAYDALSVTGVSTYENDALGGKTVVSYD